MMSRNMLLSDVQKYNKHLLNTFFLLLLAEDVFFVLSFYVQILNDDFVEIIQFR